MGLEIRDVGVVYPGRTQGEQVTALEGINLAIEDQDFVVALGASGCGKTTLQNLLAGFIQPSSGSVFLDGKPIEGPSADRGVIFQKHALFPWLNVIKNVAFGLKLQGVAEKERYEVAARNLELVGLEEFKEHQIYQLSGGMQQRVGIARALTCNPAMLLMDEPMGALDQLTRESLQELILDVCYKTGKMVFFITHSVEEALFMASKLVVMSPRPGRITHHYRLTFRERFRETRDGRGVKSSRDFIQMREEILNIITGDANVG